MLNGNVFLQCPTKDAFPDSLQGKVGCPGYLEAPSGGLTPDAALPRPFYFGARGRLDAVTSIIELKPGVAANRSKTLAVGRKD